MDTSVVRAEGVDPRDITVEVRPTAYRVHFHKDNRTHVDEQRVTGASGVHEVIAWADARVEASPWRYDLYAEVVIDGTPMLIELSVVDRPDPPINGVSMLSAPEPGQKPH